VKVFRTAIYERCSVEINNTRSIHEEVPRNGRKNSIAFLLDRFGGILFSSVLDDLHAFCHLCTEAASFQDSSNYTKFPAIAATSVAHSYPHAAHTMIGPLIH
jgi:hypothetical protein